MKFLKLTTLYWAGLWYSEVDATGTALERFLLPCRVVHGRMVCWVPKEEGNTYGLFQKKAFWKQWSEVLGSARPLPAQVQRQPWLFAPTFQKLVTSLIVSGTAVKAEAWKREKWLVFSAAHVVCFSARKLCNVWAVFQQVWYWFSVLHLGAFLLVAGTALQ